MDYRKDDTLGEEGAAFGQRVKGAAKEAAGKVTGNRGLEREGEIENAEGRERQARNNVMDETDGVPGATVNRPAGSSWNQADDDDLGEEASALGQRTKGAVKDAWGSMTGNERVEREGERENALGRERQAANDVLGDRDASSARSAGYVTGLYTTPESANRAYQGLTERHGYKPQDINVLMTDETRKRHFGDVKPGTEFQHGTKAAEGAGKGAAIGGGIGAALAALFAVGTSVAIPGLGLVVAGPIAAALAGAGAGGATGGILGALIGAGIPEDRAEVYDRGLRDGGIVIGTRARDDRHAAELEREFGEYGGSDVIR
jgi:uncharacterized protein YjbJ (UPF0337 family)